MPNSMMDIMKYLRLGSKDAGHEFSTEFKEFWKLLTEEEKEEYKNTKLK